MSEESVQESEVMWLRSQFSKMQEIADRQLRKAIENEDWRRIAEKKVTDLERQVSKHIAVHIVCGVLLFAGLIAIAVTAGKTFVG